MAEGENAERHVEFTLETVDGSATRELRCAAYLTEITFVYEQCTE